MQIITGIEKKCCTTQVDLIYRLNKMSKNIKIEAESDEFKLIFEIPVLVCGRSEDYEEVNELYNTMLEPTIRILCIFLRLCIKSNNIELITIVENTIKNIAEDKLNSPNR